MIAYSIAIESRMGNVSIIVDYLRRRELCYKS